MPIKGPYGFIKGWNTKGSTTTMPENSMSDANDVNIVYGDLVQRQGSLAINSAAISGTPAVHGLFDWQSTSGQRYLVITAGTKIFKAADLSSTFTDITGSVTITSGAGNQSTFASLNNNLVRAGGGDNPIYWNGTGNAATVSFGGLSYGSLVCMANNFLFMSGVSTDPSLIRWSNVNDPLTWTSTNFVYYRKSDGDKIIALIEFNQNLLIFKRRSIGQLWTVTSNPSLASITLGPLTTISSNIGCVGSQALDKIGDGRIAFLGSNAHVYLFDGSTSEDISDQQSNGPSIQPTLNALSPSQLSTAVLRYYPTLNELWLSVSEVPSTTNSVIYVYSLTYNCWESRFNKIAANVMTTSVDTRGTPSHNIIMLTGNYGGLVYEQDRGNTNAEDSGNLINGNATLPIFFGADPNQFIPRSAMIPIAENGATTLTVNYAFNEFNATISTTNLSQLGGATLDSFILGTSTLSASHTLYRTCTFVSVGLAHSMQIQFKNNSSAQSFTVHPFYVSDEVISV